MRAPAGVLHERRTSRRQIALRAIAEPSRPARHVGVLGDPEFRLRALDVIAVIPERTRDAHRVDRRPSVLAKQSLRPVHSQLEPLNGVSGKVDEPQELAILVAIDVREALGLPGHHGREPVSAGRRVGAPEIGNDWLPRLVPGEPAGGHVRGRRPDVGAEREQAVEPAKEVDVPALTLRNGKLGEHRIRIDEHASGNPCVLVAPEPGAAGQVHEQISVRAIRAHLFTRASVIRAVVVDEAPLVAQTERFERVVDVAGAV